MKQKITYFSFSIAVNRTQSERDLIEEHTEKYWSEKPFPS